MTRPLALGALVAAALPWPAASGAQTGAPQSAVSFPAGFYLTPSVTAEGVVDDSVFLTTSSREADFIVRLRPGVSGGGYRSAPLTILGSVAVDAEKYTVHDELDNVGDRSPPASTSATRPTAG